MMEPLVLHNNTDYSFCYERFGSEYEPCFGMGDSFDAIAWEWRWLWPTTLAFLGSVENQEAVTETVVGASQ